MRIRSLFAVLAVAALSLGVTAEEQKPTMEEILARMKAMEKKISDQENEIHGLKGQLKQAEQISQVRPTVDAAVDRALKKSTGSDRFFHDPGVHQRAIRIGGHVDISYQFSFNTPEKIDPEAGMIMPRNNFRIFDRDESNDFAVNQAEIHFDGTAQEPGQAGFRIDLNFGEDTVTQLGLTGEQVFTFNNLEQAYIDYIAPFGNGVRITAGRFVTPIGFEVIESHGNWNATRSFNFGLGIPFTHTGLKAEYQVFDNWSVAAMVVNGWDNTVDNNDDKTFILQSTWKPAEWVTWVVNGAIGNEGGRMGNDEGDIRYLVNTNVLFDPGKAMDFFENWQFGLNANFGYEEDEGFHKERAFMNPIVGNVFPVPGIGSDNAMWWGVAGYAKYQFLQDWYVAGRAELFNDMGGTRTGLVDFNNLGQKVKLYSFTATVAWDIAKPLQVRFEYRHDGSDRSAYNTRSYNTLVDGDTDPSRGGRSTQDTFMIQWLYQF